MLSMSLPLASEIIETSQDVLRVILALFFIFAGITHFTQIGEDYVRMMPSWVPFPMLVMLVTGVLEIAGGIGLLIPGLIPIAALLLTFLLIAIFPANLHAAQKNIPFRGKPPMPLALRTVIQAVLIGLLIWIAVF